VARLAMAHPTLRSFFCPLVSAQVTMTGAPLS